MKFKFERRVLAIIRKHGVFAVSSLSIMAILSIFTVHTAGFLFKIPSEFWSLIDGYFISNLLIQFSLITALAILLARLSSTFVVTGCSLLAWFLTYAQQILSKSGRRRIRAIGLKGLNSWLRQLPTQTDAQRNVKSSLRDVKRHSVRTQLQAGRNIVFSNTFTASEVFTQKYNVAIQGLTVTLVFSTLYTHPFGAILTIIFLTCILYLSPPSLMSVKGVKLEKLTDIVSLTRDRYTDFLSMKKAAILLLTASFLLGSFHHTRVIGRDGLTGFGSDIDQPSNIVLVTSTGVLVHSDEHGYRFFSSQLASRSAVFEVPELE